MLPGPVKAPCACGCSLYGTNRYGPAKHVRGCACVRCGGKRSYRQGHQTQGEFARALGLVAPGTRARTHEEDQRGPLRFESKWGVQAGPAITAFLKVQKQSEASRPVGDWRPFVGCFADDRAAIVAMHRDDWERHITPLLLAGWE